MANQNVPGSNPAFDAIYNASGFDGQVTSDWMRLGGIPEALKKDLIDFSTADFDAFKTSFQNYVKSVYPQDYNNFVESDLGQMLTELFAYQAAVLSFKADALAQENYLATAKTSQGLTKLLELIGISLRGPVPAKARATLTITDPALFLGTFPSDNLVITEADRTVDAVSTRDGLPLTYTLYRVDNNGNINMDATDIVLNSADFDDTGLICDDKLLLLEGRQQSQEGTFLKGSTNQTINLTLPSIVEGSIAVSASDGWYSEVDNIWFASAGAKVFQKKYNEDYSCSLLFGDGVVGQSPSPGSDYKVFYRTGGGLRGNITANQLEKSATVQFTRGATISTGDVSIVNPVAGTGGVNAQSLEEARRYGPLWFATQYRAVTGQDYTAFANKFRSTAGKTGKGLAVLRDNGSAGNMIDIYVLQEATENHLERASFEFKNEMLAYLNQYRMLTDELTIVDGVVRTLDLVTTLYIDRDERLSAEDVKQRISGSIQDYFSINTLDFGKPLILSNLINYVLTDPGARFFSIDNYANDVYVDFNEIIQLNNVEINVQFV